MDPTYWQKKWKENDIRFHQAEVHSMLKKYGHLLNRGTVLVPFCGKTFDMVWLSQQGHSALGVELSPIACEAFFKENNLSYEKSSHGPFTIYKGNGITLWCGDFFEIPADVFRDVMAIYDRAALIACPDDLRPRYAKRIKEIAQHQLSMLLVTLEYPKGKVEGPPFLVLESEIHSVYGDRFSIKKLESYPEDNLRKEHPKFLNVDVNEVVYFCSSGGRTERNET